MVVSSYDIDEVIWVVCCNREVLSWSNHLSWIRDFTFVVYQITSITTWRLISFKSSNEQELIIRNIDSFEIMRDFVYSHVLLIIKLELFKLTGFLYVMECLELMSVESHQWHREVWIVSNFANLVDKIYFRRKTVEIRKLELWDGEKVCCFFHRPL